MKFRLLVLLMATLLTPAVSLGQFMPSQAITESKAGLAAAEQQDWKTAAFSQFHRGPRVTPDKGDYMGLSMVTPRFHYVEWREWDDSTKSVGALSAVELYDLQADPDENTNIADAPGSKSHLESLSAQLQRGWRGAASSLQH